MEIENKRHVQLPNNMTVDDKLSPKDLLIYVSIRRYMNSVTKEAFPSLETIMKHASASKPTVRKCIENLKTLGYITVNKKGRNNLYKFNPHKNFEPFSYDFLDKEDLTSNEKAYLIVSQQYMFKEGGFGNISYTDRKLAGLINMSPHSVTKYNKSLLEKSYLSIVKTDKKDVETGLMINEKMFHLNELEQAIVFTLQNHEDRLNDTDKRLNSLEATFNKTMNIVLKENRRLQQKLETVNEEVILI